MDCRKGLLGGREVTETGISCALLQECLLPASCEGALLQECYSSMLPASAGCPGGFFIVARVPWSLVLVYDVTARSADYSTVGSQALQNFSSSRVARRKMYLVRFGIGDGFLQQPSWALRPAARLFLHAAALPLGGLPCCGPCSCGSRLFTLARSTLGTPNHSPSVLRHIALSRCPSFI